MVPEALEIVDKYILENEVLPADDPNQEVIVRDLVRRVMNRYRGEIQDELGDLNQKFTHFTILLYG